MRENLVETLIGAAVLAIAVVFAVYAYTTAEVGATSGGYTLVASFDNADGLTRGTDVRVSGIKVGTVVSQALDPQTFRATVTMSIRSGVELPTDSSVKVASEGLLGGSYLLIEPGGMDEVLAPGEEFEYTQGAVNLTDLIGQAIFSAAGDGE